MEFVNHNNTMGMNFVGDKGGDGYEDIFLERWCPHLWKCVLDGLMVFNAFYEYCENNKIEPTFENCKKYWMD